MIVVLGSLPPLAVAAAVDLAVETTTPLRRVSRTGRATPVASEAGGFNEPGGAVASMPTVRSIEPARANRSHRSDDELLPVVRSLRTELGRDSTAYAVRKSLAERGWNVGTPRATMLARLGNERAA